jgi:hypothetical protein
MIVPNLRQCYPRDMATRRRRVEFGAYSCGRDGERRADNRTKLACNGAFVRRWTKAFEFQGPAGLVSLHPGRVSKQPGRN